MKYSFITQKKKTYPVGLMCRLMGVSRSAYYDYVWRSDSCSADPCHEEILETVQSIANSSHHSYGSRRIGKALNALGYQVGRWKARSLMREAGVQARHRKKYKVTTDSKHKQPVFENKLNQQFNVVEPNRVYVGDISVPQHHTWLESVAQCVLIRWLSGTRLRPRCCCWPSSRSIR